jgi:hypothetical protein
VQKGRFVETFMLDSWLEHLRQHERVTDADRNIQESARRFQIDGVPKVTHLIAPRADNTERLRPGRRISKGRPGNSDRPTARAGGITQDRPSDGRSVQAGRTQSCQHILNCE